MKPLVTIITPSYNQGQFIRETIESVLSQSYDNIEYIVVDGGSTDITLDILSEYEGRLTYISEHDEGQSDAINKGFRMAKGEIVAWLNSDDIYEPCAVEKAVEILVNNQNVALVYGEGYIIDEKGNKVKRFEYTTDFNLWSLIYIWDYIMQPTTFFRADALKNVGYLNKNLYWTMDWELWIKLALKYDVLYTNSFLACSREYIGTKTSTGGMKRLDEIEKMLAGFSGENKSIGYWIYYYSELSYQHRENIPIRDKFFHKAMSIINTLPVPNYQNRCGRTTYFAIRKQEQQKNLIICLDKNVDVKLNVYINDNALIKVVLDKTGIYRLPIVLGSQTRKEFHIIQIEIESKELKRIKDRSDSWLKMRLVNENCTQEGKLLSPQISKMPLLRLKGKRKYSSISSYKKLLKIQNKKANKKVPIIKNECTLNFCMHGYTSFVNLIGWHGNEEHGRWCSEDSKLVFKVKKPENFILKISYFSMSQVGDTRLLLNGQQVGILKNGVDQLAEVLLPRSLFKLKEEQTIEFICDGAISPKDANVGEDTRRLSVFIKEIKFKKG